VTQSQVAWWDPKDEWALENRGGIPNIEVQWLPQEIVAGMDPQLDRGIEEVLILHEENPPAKPDFGPSMKRSRKSYRNELQSFKGGPPLLLLHMGHAPGLKNCDAPPVVRTVRHNKTKFVRSENDVRHQGRSIRFRNTRHLVGFSGVFQGELEVLPDVDPQLGCN